MLYQSIDGAALAHAICPGTPAWFAWLDQHPAFLFETPLVRFTARKERRAGGLYWYAYRRHHGKLRTAYLGKSEELTLERLHAVAATLHQIERNSSHPAPESEPSHKLNAQASPVGGPPAPLPIPLTPLVGREEDVAAASALLLREDVRLVSLIGTGGVGKTRLALQVASDMRERFTDGVYFVALAPVRDAQLALSTIAQALGLSEEPDGRLRELVEGYLQDKNLLLVLDNFEQVMPAASLLVDLLSCCSRFKLLVTSRELLRLCGEHHFQVAPLAFPDASQLSSLDSLGKYPAVELFLQRAQAVIPDMAMNPATMHAIAQVCARVEGLPLAIELAAARVRLLPPQALATRLGRRLEVLTQGGPDMPERHKTLRATFTWSRDLLSDEEQRLFRRLSVFVGGCTLEAAEAVCGIYGDLEAPFLDVVSSLVSKSLLQTRRRGGEESSLYLLETIREYALECLAESGELERIQEAHAAYYMALAGEAEPDLYRQRHLVRLDGLRQDNENLRSAFNYLMSRRNGHSIADYQKPNPKLGRPAGLTKREMEALLLVAEGLSNDQIADRLVVSTATIKTYLSAIYTKLGVSSRTAAMRYVIDNSLDAVSISYW
jgi:predicted ATPase